MGIIATQRASHGRVEAAKHLPWVKSSPLQGLMNGTFLVVPGLVWPHLRLHALLLRVAYWLALVGLNWAVPLAAAAWGAGGTTMPLAASGHLGTQKMAEVLCVARRLCWIGTI